RVGQRIQRRSVYPRSPPRWRCTYSPTISNASHRCSACRPSITERSPGFPSLSVTTRRRLMPHGRSCDRDAGSQGHLVSDHSGLRGRDRGNRGFLLEHGIAVRQGLSGASYLVQNVNRNRGHYGCCNKSENENIPSPRVFSSYRFFAYVLRDQGGGASPSPP